jgi:hypothetical protein
MSDTKLAESPPEFWALFRYDDVCAAHNAAHKDWEAKRWPSFAVVEEECARVQMSNVAGYSQIPLHRLP